MEQALNVENKLKALKEILAGKVTEENMTILNEDWDIVEHCSKALQYGQLSDLDLSQKINSLSGGQKTKALGRLFDKI